MTDADVLVVGGGIAGWSAAWFAAQRGREVTLVDEGVHRASDLPVALVNPLRGHAGRLVARGVDGMHATFALIDRLRADGHAIDGGRGLYRPLIDRTGDEAYWRSALDGALAFDWHATAPDALGLVDAVPTLYLRHAGWVAPAGLLAALAPCATTRIVGRVEHIGAAGGATLTDGTTIRARTTLWCGGAWGAALLDAGHASDARYKPGSLLAGTAPFTGEALSFGLYALPWRGGTLVGPTREGSRSTFPHDEVAAEAVRHLEARVAATFVRRGELAPAWRGVRLARLSTRAVRALAGTATLTELGSRGFLMAPLLAAEWAGSL